MNTPTAFLEGKKVLLRAIEAADLSGPYAEWINAQDADLLTEHAQFPTNHHELAEYRKTMHRDPNSLWLAIIDRSTSRHVGNIEISKIDWVHRKGTYAILIGDTTAHSKGFGFESSLLILAHAFGKLNLHRVELGVHEDNLAARALYRKLGFVEEGVLRQTFLRDGEFKNSIVMGILASEFNAANPGNPPVNRALIDELES